MAPKNITRQGFSLIQVSVLIAVAGIILASVLPGGSLGSDAEKERITREKMEKIEAATQSFMAANLRRPCPADGTLAAGSANFGKEDSTPGRCSGANFYAQSSPVTKTGTVSNSDATVTAMNDTTGLAIGMLVTGTTIAADTHIAKVDSDTQITLDKYGSSSGADTLTFTSVVAGVVPTRTLGLPDDYMFDGYGRRISYMVDIRATNPTTCRNMQITNTTGAIQLMDSATTTYTTDSVMWALISYGKNGHGAFPMQGSSIANRINSGATNDDERLNAFVATGTTSFATAFTQKLIKHEPVSTSGTTYFDDTVWTQESTKNTCCTGKMCNLGTRLYNNGAGGMVTSRVILGDINGDGIQDIVVFTPNFYWIYVIFGTATGWAMPATGMDLSLLPGLLVNNKSRYIGIGNDSGYTNFMRSDMGTGYSLAVGDINGDGYDDIAIGYGNAANSYIKIFYGSASPVSTSISAIPDTITFPSTSINRAPTIVLGNFASTNKKDILALVKTASGTGNSTAYVIYGASSYSLTAESVTAASNGFKINTTTPSTITVLTGAGDLNNDGYDEIIFNDVWNKSIYVLFGQSAANWDSDKTTAGPPDIINIDTRLAAGATKAVKFINGIDVTIGQIISVADMNGDGYKDLVFWNQNYFNIYYGKATGAWASPIDLSDTTNYDGATSNKGFHINTSANAPSWYGCYPTVLTTDVNNDGKTDFIFSNSCSGPVVSGSGAAFIALQPSAGWTSIGTGGTINLFGDIFDAAGNGLPLNNDVSKGFRIDGNDNIGYSDLQAVGDINNDGRNDIIVNSGTRGKIHIFFGRKFVPWDTTNSIGLLE
jgi:type II secretory pathway pseudopilin PulG